MEIARWFCPYCCEYYLLAYIIQHKLTMKHQTNKAEFEKRYDEKVNDCLIQLCVFDASERE